MAAALPSAATTASSPLKVNCAGVSHLSSTSDKNPKGTVPSSISTQGYTLSIPNDVFDTFVAPHLERADLAAFRLVNRAAHAATNRLLRVKGAFAPLPLNDARAFCSFVFAVDYRPSEAYQGLLKNRTVQVSLRQPGNKDLLTQVIQRKAIPRDVALDLFNNACKDGDIDNAKLLVETLKPTTQEAKSWFCALRETTHPGIAKWLVERFQITAADAKQWNNFIFRNMCANGCLGLDRGLLAHSNSPQKMQKIGTTMPFGVRAGTANLALHNGLLTHSSSPQKMCEVRTP